jgi:RTX calcium-binding nonapeptide repeat (4 copies)
VTLLETCRIRHSHPPATIGSTAAGNDSFGSDRGADELIGGAGYDSAGFSRPIPRAPTAPPPSPPAGFEISLDDRANDGQLGTGEGDNVHSDIEEVYTWDGDDLLSGSAGPEVFYSQGGDDLIAPGAGADSVFAGRGDDTIRAVDQTTDRVDCELGNDSIDADLPGDQPERADVIFNCESITGVPFGPRDPRAGADTTRPVITNLRASRRRFAAGRRNTPRAAATVKRGTTVTFGLSEDARVTITIARKLRGRLKGGRCVARARSGRKCTRLVTAAMLVRANSSAGLNRVAYSGRVGGRALRPGRYRATVRAVDAAGNRSRASSLQLAVVKPRA